MKIGIPKEIKGLEGRVGLIPEAAGELTQRGHEVVVQTGAGLLSGYPDSDYEAVGVKIVPDAERLGRNPESAPGTPSSVARKLARDCCKVGLAL